MTKYFVLRPHVLLSSYDCLQRFGDDNVVVVPMAVIDEINSMKDLTLEKAKIRKVVLKYIKSLLDKGVLSEEGYKQEKGGIVKVISNYADIEVNLQNITEFQKRTLQVCLGLQNEGKHVVLVTNNIGLQIKAHTININAEEFKDEIFPILEEQYTGRIYLDINSELQEKMFKDHEVMVDDLLKLNPNAEFLENMYVIMKCGSLTFYCQVKGDKVIELHAHEREPYGVKPMNDGQKLAINAFYDNSPLVIVKGPPGTGKTLLSMAVALDRVDDKEFSRILITRSVSNDKLGFLPGNVDEKLSPFLKGVTDNLEILINGPKGKKKRKNTLNNTKNKFGKNSKYAIENDDAIEYEDEPVEHGEYLFEKGIINIQALEMLRGRSITDTIFIIDETQNIEPEFVKTIVSRAARGSKFIFIGDPTQVDDPKLSERYNALVYLSEKLKGDPDCTVVSLSDEESVRSRLAKIATQIL